MTLYDCRHRNYDETQFVPGWVQVACRDCGHEWTRAVEDTDPRHVMRAPRAQRNSK